MANKMFGAVVTGTVDLSLEVTLHDSTTGAGLTGVAFGSVTTYYYRQGAASAVQITMASLAANNTVHTDGGWREIDSTNMPGVYRLDSTDAAFATGAEWVHFNIRVTGADAVNFTVPLNNLSIGTTGGVLLQPTTHTSAVIPTVSTLTGHTAQTGDSYAIVNSSTFGNSKLVRSTTPANTLTVNASNQASIDGSSVTLGSTERNAIAAAIWLSSPATESYAADGAIPTLAQFLFMIQQRQNEFAKVTTTITVKKLDGTTTAATFTLNDSTNPTTITRAS